eukprot:12885083-Prorocentrum_lima.AAC.1
MRLSRSLKEIGYHQGVTDQQIWRKFSRNSRHASDNHCGYHPNLVSMTSTHTDDMKGGAIEAEQKKLLATLKKH